MLAREVARDCIDHHSKFVSLNISSYTEQQQYFHEGELKSIPFTRTYSLDYECNDPVLGEGHIATDTIALVKCEPLTGSLKEIGEKEGLSALPYNTRLTVDYRIAQRALIMMEMLGLPEITVKYGKSAETWNLKKVWNIIDAARDLKVNSNPDYILASSAPQ